MAILILVLTRAGYDDLLKTLGRVPAQLWVNAGVLSESELLNLRGAGHDVTNFTNEIPAFDVSAIADAIHTVREHHPLQRLWVEYAPEF
ncbi:MAG TPA: hypothetical protein VK747_13715 [Blastocatellia bacterium]|nr:hypothetical protein [Blastocatellia bacterium]